MHTRLVEVYLVARGSALLRVGRRSVRLAARDMIAVEPGEPHTFLESSPDYFHFVVHAPGTAGDVARADKVVVPRDALGL